MPGVRPTKRLLKGTLVSVALGTVGCASAPKAPNLIADETNGPLGNVLLLPLTTRSTDDLLGHAWSAETDLADPLRGVLSGTVMVTSTDQRIPLRSVCRTLTPEQEMAPLQLKAAPNCVIQRYSTLGEKETLSRQLPNEQLCDDVAKRYCSELGTLLSCRVRFGDAEEVELAPRAEAAPAKPAVSKPASTAGENRIKKK